MRTVFVDMLLLAKLDKVSRLPRCDTLPRTFCTVEATDDFVIVEQTFVYLALNLTSLLFENLVTSVDTSHTIAFASNPQLFIRDRRLVERAKELRHEPGLIALRVIGPGTTENDELDLVTGMSHLRKRT